MTDDLPFFDGLEVVTLTIGGDTHEVEALRRPLAPRFESGAQIDRAAWHLRGEDLDGDTPVVGDVLEAGDEEWTVKEVERLSFGTRFRLVCERTA